MNFFSFLTFLVFLSSINSCNSSQSIVEPTIRSVELDQSNKPTEGLSIAYFASGCFWCVEAVFESVTGVGEVISGYSGGSQKDANYADVSAGITDHAESVMVYYDPTVIDYQTLLVVFFGSQDPTTLNRQGPDRGRQYRSSIFYQNDEEKIAAENYIKELDSQKIYANKIATELVPFEAFYPAEEYHQDFEERNPNQGYVKAVSVPRLNEFKRKFPELLKPGLTLH